MSSVVEVGELLIGLKKSIHLSESFAFKWGSAICGEFIIFRGKLTSFKMGCKKHWTLTTMMNCFRPQSTISLNSTLNGVCNGALLGPIIPLKARKKQRLGWTPHLQPHHHHVIILISTIYVGNPNAVGKCITSSYPWSRMRLFMWLGGRFSWYPKYPHFRKKALLECGTCHTHTPYTTHTTYTQFALIKWKQFPFVMQTVAATQQQPTPKKELSAMGNTEKKWRQDL